MSLPAGLNAFYTDHGRCGDRDGGVEGPVVWIAWECGANIGRCAEGATHLTPTVDPPYRPGMDRRRFLLTSLAGALAAPLGAERQQASKMARIGVLSSFAPCDAAPRGIRLPAHNQGRWLSFASHVPNQTAEGYRWSPRLQTSSAWPSPRL